MNQSKAILFLFLILPIWASSQKAQVNSLTDLYEFTENKGQWHPNILFRTQQNALDLQIGKDFINYYFFEPTQIKAISELAHHHKTPLAFDSLSVYGLRLQFLNALPANPILNKPKPHYYNFYQGTDQTHWVHGAKASTDIGLNQLYAGIDLHIHSAKNQLKYEFWLEPKANINNIQIEISGAKKIYTEYGDLYIETPFAKLREQKPFAYQVIDGKQVQVDVWYVIKGNTLSFETNETYQSKYPLVIDPEIIFLTYSGSSVDNFGFTATPGENGTMYAGGIATGPYSNIPFGKYPCTADAFQIGYAGGGFSEGDLFNFPCDITFNKYNADGTTLLYATYLGGANNELPTSLVIDKDNNLILMGNSYSNNYPTTSNAYDKIANGKMDFIVTKFNSAGVIQASTYIGGDSNDAINLNKTTNFFYGDQYRSDVTSDDQGNIIVVGVSQSPNFPTTASVIQTTLSGTQDGVVFKMNPDLSVLKWSTYIGGSGIDAFYSIDIGPNKQLYISGGTSSPTFPGTIGHMQPSFGGGQADGIICILDSNAKNIIGSSYFGTPSYDQIFNLEIDKDNLIYVVGQSNGTIPVTPGKYSNPNSHQFIACIDASLQNKIWSTVFGSGRPDADLTINAFLVDDCKRIYVSSWGGNDAFDHPSSTKDMPITEDAFQSTSDGSDFYLMLLNKNATGLLYGTYIGGQSPINSGDHVDGGTSRFDKQGIVYQSMCASCPIQNVFGPFSDLNTTPNSYSPVNKSPRCSNAALKFDFRINNANFDWVADTCSSTFTFYNKTKNASNFFWTFPDGDTSFQESPTKFIAAKYFGDTIRLIVEFGTNCADTAYGFVTLPDTVDVLKVPNVFTPNNDGLNDFFGIEGISGQCSETEVYIYNRWGQLYFEDKVSYFRWDGRDKKGQEAPEGVYFFMLHTKKLNTGQEEDIHGTITLIR
ncbi:MAG: hypothetical protein CFE21_02250 [Bacteroidetes bacterium B1(2017)]|nr:MAG: hypothetical protein CFE21_02250 [Bacteroidetes bacterium B1(2017)]